MEGKINKIIQMGLLFFERGKKGADFYHFGFNLFYLFHHTHDDKGFNKELDSGLYG